MLDKNLIQTLTDIGFDPKEARTYLATLELGTASATQIASKAELKRSIVYYVIDKLRSRGYVQEVEARGVKRFSAVDPSKIFKVASAAVEELRFMLPLIRAMQEKGTKKPRIEYLDDRSSILSMFRLYDRGKSQRFITSIERLSSTISEDPGIWAGRYESGKIRVRTKTLLTDTPKDHAWAERVRATGQDVRFLPHKLKLDLEFAMVDDILGITSLDPLFMVVIHSEPAARSAAALFDFVWESGRK
jgi:sugar-specific transcriptional regulator TrmB